MIRAFIPVMLESPYSGDVFKNMRYLRLCMHDCIVNHGEAPFASHGLYTQPGVLDDKIPEERDMGVEAGFSFRQFTRYTVIYTDLGTSMGMVMGINHANKLFHQIVYRSLGKAFEEFK